MSLYGLHAVYWVLLVLTNLFVLLNLLHDWASASRCSLIWWFHLCFLAFCIFVSMCTLPLAPTQSPLCSRTKTILRLGFVPRRLVIFAEVWGWLGLVSGYISVRLLVSSSCMDAHKENFALSWWTFSMYVPWALGTLGVMNSWVWLIAAFVIWRCQALCEQKRYTPHTTPSSVRLKTYGTSNE